MIPLKVIEEHNEAFSVWFDAVADGTVPRGAVLIHVDHHDDMECNPVDSHVGGECNSEHREQRFQRPKEHCYLDMERNQVSDRNTDQCG